VDKRGYLELGLNNNRNFVIVETAYTEIFYKIESTSFSSGTILGPRAGFC